MSISNFHVHFFFDVYSPAQVGSNWAQQGAEAQGAWQLTEERRFSTAGSSVAVVNAPDEAERICVVVADSGHGVVNPENVACADLPG